MALNQIPAAMSGACMAAGHSLIEDSGLERNGRPIAWSTDGAINVEPFALPGP